MKWWIVATGSVCLIERRSEEGGESPHREAHYLLNFILRLKPPVRRPLRRAFVPFQMFSMVE